MGGVRLHVFGTGPVVRAFAVHLTGLGLAVRKVSRHRPPGLAGGAGWRAAGTSDAEAATGAAQGASVIDQCLNAPYTQWPERFPPLQRGRASRRRAHRRAAGEPREQVQQRPGRGRPMTEDLPLAATTVKGRTRAAMTGQLLAAANAGRVRAAIGRASDFSGAGVEGSALGNRVFANALAGRRTDLIGNPDLLHTCSCVPDIAAGLATLGPGAPAARQSGWGHSMRSVTSPPGRTCSPAVQPTSIDTPPRSRT
jgi:hypothetical protein